MSAAGVCRPRAKRIVRQLGNVPAVVDADALDPSTGPRAEWTVEIVVDDDRLPASVLAVLARSNADVTDASPQGNHTTAVATL